MAPKRSTKSDGRAVKKDNSFTKANKQAKQVEINQSLVDLVNRRPSVAQQILDYGLDLEDKHKTAPENDCWPRNYYRLKQASVTYMTAVLKQCKPDWKESTWTRLRSQPPLQDSGTITALERLFYFATATNPDNPIITNRAVCTKVLVDRYNQFGKRLDSVVLQENGWVDWKQTGYYKLVRDNETQKVISIEYVGGKKAMPCVAYIMREGCSSSCSEFSWELTFGVRHARNAFTPGAA